jgi:hypothetical protein
MKRMIFLFIILGFASAFNKSTVLSNPASPGFGMHFGFFYSSLSPHGEWIEVESGFQVWRPHRIPHQWRPYLIGQWVWTDYGWYWMSNEPFGWVTYHYGRWYYDDYYGWVWVPDDVWGPAWVEWRYDNDYIGWAPLPPYATFSVSIGIHFTNHWVASARYWNFVRYRHFGGVLRYRDTAPESHARRLIRTTRSGYRYETSNNRIINHGVDRTIIERRGRVQIQRVAVQEERKQSGERLVRSNNNRNIERIEIYRPTRDEMQRNVERTNVRRSDRALSIDMNKIERQRTEQRQPDRVNRREPQKEVRQEREVQRQEPPKESKPRVQQQKQQSDQREKRKELLQRHENKQNPSPPVHQERKQKIERQRQKMSNAPSNRSTPERQTTRSRGR